MDSSDGVLDQGLVAESWEGFLRPAIAIISVHGDPAIEVGREEAGGQNVYVRNVGEALSHLGWTVDMFTRRVSPTQSTIVEHRSYCRTIRLSAGPATFIARDDLFEYLPEFVDHWLQFQKAQGIQYALVHTNYWLSSWVDAKGDSALGSGAYAPFSGCGEISKCAPDSDDRRDPAYH
jgi:D-inositol-3-phosphate glycosyltransferase